MTSVCNLRAPRRALGAATLLVALALAGCADDMSDLRRHVEQVKQRPGGPIEPIPEMKPFETFVYPDNVARDPFARLSFAEPEKARRAAAAATGPKPDPTRPREALEDFQLDSLSYVGTLQRQGQLWALIQDTGGTIHRVQTGNFMGQNYGRIDAIAPTSIELRELIPNPDGGWIEREASLALND